jgi:succinate dehydrogenase / fumarate reductase flavoprotein subunit
MAIGEAACVSVHGANRLGSNSLLDIVVFGRAAANRCVEMIDPDSIQPELPMGAGDDAIARLDARRHAKGGTAVAALRGEMQATMQTHCAVFRSKDVLVEGQKKMSALWSKMDDMRVSDRSMVWNSDLMEALEMDNMILQAVVSLDGALNREESRGGHAREDFPDRDDDKWMKHTLSWIDENGKTRFDYRPVHGNTLTDDVEPVPPKERVY